MVVARSPGIISSSETPTMETSGPNVASIARRSFISSAHGTHHVAQTFITRKDALGEKASAILAGSFTSTRFAASAAARIRQKAANRTHVRIGANHGDIDMAALFVRLGALCAIG